MNSHALARHAGRWYGKYAGSVVDNENPNGLGWISVEVPSLYPEGETLVARPCFPAGRFWVPPVGAHVWVEFEAGDPTSPLWVGTWYITGEVPEAGDVTPPTSQVLHTPGGHVIELSDAEGDQRITITNQNEATVTMDDSGAITVEARGGSARVVLESSGAVTVDASTLEINANSTTISGSAEVGGPGAQEVVLKTILPWLQAHVHGSAMGPTGPPIPPPTPETAYVSSKLKATL